MAREWMKNVRQVEPYVPGEQPRTLEVTKLNTNENPYPPAPGVRKVLAEVTDDALRRYPDPECRVLRQALADYHGVTLDEVFVGVGSDDVLAMAFMTFFHGEKPVLFPDITYAFNPVWANLLGIPFATCPLGEDYRIRKEDYFQGNGGIVIPNPNAPTSLWEPLQTIEEIAAANPGSVVIVDEAYIDFGGESALPLIRRYDNLLVTRTFSKSRSLAGMRIGYALGSPELIAAMNSVKFSYNSYTLNAAALAAGVASLQDEAYFRETITKIKDTRDAAVERLTGLGFTVLTPSANFVYAAHGTWEARDLFRALREAGIIVRYFDKPRIHQFLRITIGKPEEMEKLYHFLENYQG